MHAGELIFESGATFEVWRLGVGHSGLGLRCLPSPDDARRVVDLDRDEWVAGAVAGGVPAEYGAVLRVLAETIASGHGSRPNSDVEKATGVAQTSFADFARRTAAAWAVDEFR